MTLDGLLELDPNERVLMIVKRHWAGLIPTIFSVVVVFAVGLVGAFLLSSFRDRIEQFVALPLATGALLTLVVFILFVLGVSFWVYTHNLLIVTNEKVVQVLYFSPFNRQISRIILQDIQDVTYQQIGVGSRIFKYGAIRIETAGEAAHFEFPYAANPHEVSQNIGAMCEELRRTPAQSVQQYTNQQQPPSNNDQQNQNQAP